LLANISRAVFGVKEEFSGRRAMNDALPVRRDIWRRVIELAKFWKYIPPYKQRLAD
jgi:hypothetical protein